MAFVIAPLVPAFGLSGGHQLEWSLALYPFAALATLLLGLPAYLLGKGLDLIRWWSASIVGFLVGAIVWLSQQWQLLVYPSPVVPPWSLAEGCLEFTALGGIGGFVFWLVRSFGHTEDSAG